MNFSGFLSGLKKFQPEKIVFVGLGNEFRGDDSAGLVFLNMLKSGRLFSKSCFINAGTNPENYLHDILLLNPSAVVFIDSVHDSSSSKKGRINWIETTQIDHLEVSTHSFSIKLIEEYLKENIPMEVRILGISISSGKIGERISQKTLHSIEAFFENTTKTDNKEG